MKYTPTTSIILDERRKKKDGTYATKLRVTYNRKQKYYGTGISLSKADYEKVMTLNVRGKLKDLNLRLKQVEIEANGLVEKLEPFSFEVFEKLFLEKRLGWDVIVYLTNREKTLTEQNHISTASLYRYAKESLKLFSGKERLDFSEVNPNFLEEYEKWMNAKGKSPTTIGMYVKCVQYVFNQAITDEIIKKSTFPFGKGKYVIPASRNIKKALSISEIKKIHEYQALPRSQEEKYRDFWMFIYLCNGINPKDLLNLKFENIQGDSIIFRRIKTLKTTKHNNTPISAHITDDMHQIIEKWGNKETNKNHFIFPIINTSMDEYTRYMTIKQFVKMVNKYINRIGKEIGINHRITTYTARHTYATISMRAGAPDLFLKESLGHSSLRSTQNYLGSFEDEARKIFAKALTDFKE